MADLTNKARLLASSTLVALTLLASPAIASAQHGTDDTTSSHDTVTTTATSSTGESETETSSSSGSNTNSAETEQTHTTTTSGTSGKDSLKDRAEQLLSSRRQTTKQHSEVERQKTCEARQTGIDERLSNLGSRAQKFLDRYNTTFTKVQAYQAKQQLAVANYDTLVANVTAAQTTATTAVTTLKGLAGTKIDCSASDPAATVATVKTAADDARTSLQAYRSSLKTLIQALLAASKTTNPTTNGSDQ